MRRLLIVEDDRFISAIFTMFLKELGHELVGKCQSGREALRLCHELKPDVVLMDIHLDGELDGIQTAEMLKRELDIPVIYVSSDTSSHVIKRAIVSNSYGFLVKPINKKELGIGIDLAFYKHRVDVEQKERERGYRQFISDSPLPIVIVREGKIQYLNNLALHLFKTHYIEDVMLMPFDNYVQEASKQDVFAYLSRLKDKERKEHKLAVHMKDVHGQPFFVELAGAAVKFNQKDSIQIIMRDIANDLWLKRQIEAYRKVLQKSNIPYIITDAKLNLIEVSSIAQIIPGIDFNEPVETMLQVCLDETKGQNSVNAQSEVEGVVKIGKKEIGPVTGLKIFDDRNRLCQIIFVLKHLT
ncbi:response regulator [Marinilabiliaceae bacterium JC017]|nr:response regulator [Marinilabiliaceae bacterium JC017]